MQATMTEQGSFEEVNPDQSAEDVNLKEKAKVHASDRLGPTTSLKTLKQILESYGKSDGENTEKKVLDPEHPLMIKYQNDLKEHLLKLHQDTDEQLYNLNGAIQDQTKGNDDVGKRMCMLQKELIKLKQDISKFSNENQKAADRKEKSVKKLNDVKSAHKSLNEVLQNERKKDFELQKKIEDLSLQVVQLKQLQLESYSDSSTMKCAMEKTTKERENLEIEKLRQDMLIARLEEDQHRFQDKIHLYKSQCAIKKEELSGIRKVLTEAASDIEAIHFEKLQLMQQWNYSIASLEKRDKTGALMRDSVRHHEDDMRMLNMDIMNYKKTLRKELEENERHTLQLLQRDSDVAQLEKQIKNCKTRQQNLEEQYAFFDQVIQHTEGKLATLNNEKLNKERELETKAKQLEKICATQRDMEAEYMKVLHDKITITKASHYNEKLIKDCRAKTENLETNCVLKEGEEAKLRLKLGDASSHLQAMEDNLNALKKEYSEKEKTVARSEAEIAKCHNLIEKKQAYILELNKKLSALINEAGGMELGPLEREISNIKKEIANSEQSRKTMEQEWLRHQRQLVSLTNEASARFKEIDMLRKKEAVLEEKKIRVGADLAREENEIKELYRSIERTQKDMSRLTALLHHEKGSQEKLEQEAELLKGDFLNLLKEAELEFVRKENEVECLRKKHAKLLYQLIHAQRETILWEEKLHLAEETRKILKSESHANEIAIFKSEIRRLQVRWDQIKKEEAMLIQLMEKAAFQHATLYVKADFQSFCGVKKKSKQYLSTKTNRLKRIIQEHKKKLENILEDINSKNKLMYELKREEEKEESAISSAGDQITSVHYNLQNKQREKWQGIIALSYKHKKNKLLQQVKNETYVWAVRKGNRRVLEIEYLRENLSTLKDITDHVLTVCPDLKDKLLQIIDHIIVGFKI